MSTDIGRVASPNRLSSSTGPASGSGPPGFDPARGVKREVLVRIGRDCIRNHAGADCDAEIVGMIRQSASNVTGGNCTFADDDLGILTRLATNAVRAGLVAGIHPNVASRAKQLLGGEFRMNIDPRKREYLQMAIDAGADPHSLTSIARQIEAYLCDSGRLPEGEDASAAECAASQSGPKGIAQTPASERERRLDAALQGVVRLHDDFMKAADGFMGNQADAYYILGKQFDIWDRARSALNDGGSNG